MNEEDVLLLPLPLLFVATPPLACEGFFQPRQLLHILSGSELHVQIESSSKRSESSKLK